MNGDKFGQAAGPAPGQAPEPTQQTPPAETGPPAAQAKQPDLVTIPSAAGAPQPQKYPVKADGTTYELSYDELVEAAAGGIHFTKQQQELAPIKELYDWLEATPGAPQAMIYLLQNGIPQQAIPGGMQQAPMMGQPPGAPQGGYAPPQASGYGSPPGHGMPLIPPGFGQQPPADPALQLLLNEVTDLKYDREKERFLGSHPDADLKAVEDFLVANDLPTLEAAYRVMTYEEKDRQAAIAQQQQKSQAINIEPGAEGPPHQLQVDVHNMSADERSGLARYYDFLHEG